MAVAAVRVGPPSLTADILLRWAPAYGMAVVAVKENVTAGVPGPPITGLAGGWFFRAQKVGSFVPNGNSQPVLYRLQAVDAMMACLRVFIVTGWCVKSARSGNLVYLMFLFQTDFGIMCTALGNPYDTA